MVGGGCGHWHPAPGPGSPSVGVGTGCCARGVLESDPGPWVPAPSLKLGGVRSSPSGPPGLGAGRGCRRRRVGAGRGKGRGGGGGARGGGPGRGPALPPAGRTRALPRPQPARGRSAAALGLRRDRSSGGEPRRAECPGPRPSTHRSRPLRPSTSHLSRTPSPARWGLTLEQGAQQVLVDVAGAGVVDKEAWTTADA